MKVGLEPVSHMQPHFNGQPWLFLTNCKILLPWQILGRWQLPRKGMCRVICTQVCQGNEASEDALPCRWALRSEDDAVVCPSMSCNGPCQSRKALILRPREVWGVITPRTADSRAVRPGSLTCGFHYQIWIFKNKQKSGHSHQCSGNANYVFITIEKKRKKN